MNDIEPNEPETGRPGVFRFGEFELDLSGEELRRDGEKLNINHRMFQVLSLLIERAGDIVTKEEFFEKVWSGSFVEDNNLTVTIRALRKVLGDDAKSVRFIENLPRKGYRFVASVSADPRATSEHSTREERPAAVSEPANRWVLALLTTILVGALAFAAISFTGSWNWKSSTRDLLDSIAILPFESGSTDDEYLAEGLAEGISNDLGRNLRLRVIDLRSTSHYKNTAEPLIAGRELGVRSVLTGRIEQNGNVILITSELRDVASGDLIWRQQFRRDSTDLFATQLDISQAIVQKLVPALANELSVRNSKVEERDPVAYDLYLRGRHHWNKRTQADFQRAAELFREAIDRDPTFAKAYVGLADAYTLGDFPYLNLSPEEKNALIRGTIQKALEIDDTLGEAYASLAINKCYYDWDLPGAESDYRRSLELNPNDATAHHWYGEFLSMEGRFDESFAEYDRAISLDPLSLPIKTDKALAYYYARDYDTAIEHLNKIMELNPDYERTYESLAIVYRQMGRFVDAADMMEKQATRQFDRHERSAQSYENTRLHALKLRSGAEKAGNEGFWKADLVYGDPSNISKAIDQAKLGHADNAFKYLEKALKDRNTGMVWLKVMPELDGIRPDPRYQNILRGVGFSK